jgi:hypothetical protein
MDESSVCYDHVTTQVKYDSFDADQDIEKSHPHHESLAEALFSSQYEEDKQTLQPQSRPPTGKRSGTIVGSPYRRSLRKDDGSVMSSPNRPTTAKVR